MAGQGLQVAVGDPADTTNPLVDFDGAYERVLIGSTTVANTPYLRVGGAGNQSSRIELAETTTGVDKVMNYGFSFNQTGNVSNTLEIKRHSNSTAGSTVITLARDNSNVTFAGDLTVSGGDITLGGTGRIQGIDTVSASTDAANKAYVDASVPSLTNYVTLNTAQTITGAKTFNNDVTLNNTYLLGVDKLEANQIVIGTSTSSILGNVGVVASGGADSNSIIHFSDDAGSQVNAIGALEGNILTLASQNELVFKTGTIDDVYTNTADVLFNINGNVGMGNATPAAKLDIVNTSSTSSSGLLKLKSTTVFSSAPGHMIDFIRSNNTIRGFVGMNQYGVTYSTSSDYRLKRNIVPIADSIDRIKKLKPSRFNWDDGPDDYVVDGFIAHEVADVIPEAITGEKDDVDKDNAPIYQSIDQSKIVPLLTAALQEAVARIEALELKISKLNKQ